MKTFSDEEFKTCLEEMILADLKHSQLILGLANIGLDHMDNHYLGIADLVAQLIGTQTDQGKDKFMEVYLGFMQKSTEVPVSSGGEELRMVSKECLKVLLQEFDQVYSN
ncbi:hypothetical protein [Algoriphagus yeomjeoni]|uniref:Uncharacterized protein n=1 Tax=Algoriphagus yeomjeoni TaxID=291403 RepID=A0A327P7B0_9BACT|nr:hypothetical protein [Algoriphagus yeomjeoni]RAI86802.1 hypothetical protein LV83_03359 [Algoriphagus yeomjeoni]